MKIYYLSVTGDKIVIVPYVIMILHVLQLYDGYMPTACYVIVGCFTYMLLVLMLGHFIAHPLKLLFDNFVESV